MLSIKSPAEMAKELAERTRRLRLHYAWTREELAQRSGVTVSSLKRFELSGEISLKNLLKLSFTMRALNDFDQVLNLPELRSMADIEKRQQQRQRGKRKS